MEITNLTHSCENRKKLSVASGQIMISCILQGIWLGKAFIEHASQGRKRLCRQKKLMEEIDQGKTCILDGRKEGIFILFTMKF